MINLSIKSYNIDNNTAICINYFEHRHITLSSSVAFPDITIYDVTKEELEYMASELKRIADSREG